MIRICMARFNRSQRGHRPALERGGKVELTADGPWDFATRWARSNALIAYPKSFGLTFACCITHGHAVPTLPRYDGFFQVFVQWFARYISIRQQLRSWWPPEI